MRASERAYDQLRSDILGWRVPPGAPLSEVDLAARLGVSRTPLRAALARLALEGLVDTTRGRTARVSEVSASTIEQLFELRAALETHAARLAARRRDPARFDGLARRFGAAEELIVAGAVDAYYDLVADFDGAVDEAIANAVFVAELDRVRTHLVRARRIAVDNDARLARSADEHRLICEAIRDGDEALAVSAVSVHLSNALTTIVATLEARDRQENPA